MTTEDADDRGVILADINRYRDRWLSHQTKKALAESDRDRAFFQHLMDEDQERIDQLRKRLARKPKGSEEPGRGVPSDRSAGAIPP